MIIHTGKHKNYSIYLHHLPHQHNRKTEFPIYIHSSSHHLENRIYINQAWHVSQGSSWTITVAGTMLHNNQNVTLSYITSHTVHKYSKIHSNNIHICRSWCSLVKRRYMSLKGHLWPTYYISMGQTAPSPSSAPPPGHDHL